MKNQNNQLQIFKNEELGLKARTIQNEDGSISINAEDTAVGFGWTRVKGNKEYVMWDRVNGFISDLDFPQKCGKDDFIPESLFYMLGMKASNDKAKKFQQWLAIDVIPNIRKHGGYLTDDKIEEVLLNPDTIIKLATQLKQEREARKLVEEENKVLKPKAEDYNRLISAENNQTMNEVAKAIKVGRNKLFDFLRKNKILMKSNMPYQNYIDSGYFVVREFTKVIYGTETNMTQTLVTAKGIDFINKLLKQINYEI